MLSRRTRRRLRRVRPLIVLVLLSTGALLAGAAVVAFQAWWARGDLVSARAHLQRAQSDVREGDQLAGRTSLQAARVEAHRAASRPTGWLWTAFGHVPLVSHTVRETRGIIDVTDSVTSQVLVPLVDLAPASGTWSGRADVEALRRAALPLASADERLRVERSTLNGLPRAHVRALDRARDELSDALESLAVDVRDAAVAAKTLPVILGADHPTRLLVVAQNLAEERATGGLIGSFALIAARDGHLSLLSSGSDADLVDAPKPVVDLGPDFRARYGSAEAASTWRSANLTPDVPSAGAILAGLSARQLQQRVDAVIFADTIALSELLRATGPVRVSGLGTVNSSNATSLLIKDVYQRYPSEADNPVRKQALRRSFDAVIERLSGSFSGRVGAAVGRAVATGHLRVYSTNTSVQTELARSRVSGTLPTGGPLLSVVTQDVGGSKLDYYLHRELAYFFTDSPVAVDLGVGPETVQEGVVKVRLTNGAPRAGLPPYVTARPDDPKMAGSGQLKTWVSVYLGPRSTYSSASLDGEPVRLASQVERGLTVLSTYVTIDPGQTVDLTIRVQQPAAPGAALLWLQQPRVTGDVLDIRRGRAAAAYRSLYDRR